MRRILFGILLILSAVAVRAEIMVAASLEWMAADAPVIVRGTATKCTDTKGNDGTSYREIVISVNEVLKGEFLEKTAAVTVLLTPQELTDLAPADSRHDYLFFLRAPEHPGRTVHFGGQLYTERDQAVIDLQQPRYVYVIDTTHDLHAEPDHATALKLVPMRWNMRHARDAAEILQVVKAWSAWKYRPVPAPIPENARWSLSGCMRLQIDNPAIYHEIWAGSTCYLLVPAGEQFRPLAMEKSRKQEKPPLSPVKRFFARLSQRQDLPPLMVN